MSKVRKRKEKDGGMIWRWFGWLELWMMVAGRVHLMEYWRDNESYRDWDFFLKGLLFVK